MRLEVANLLCSWEEDRKLVLRGWSLVFIFLATLLVFSVVDGRMAYVHGPYTGFIGLWIDCRRHKCANVGQVTVCRRLNKIDFLFSFLSIGIGLLILLSLTLFVINCERLRLRPQVSYLLAFYLCWCASVLMLWAGTLSFFNQVRMWSYSTPLMERRVSYFRWASRHQLPPQPNSDQNESAASSFVNYHGAPSRGDSATSQNTEEFPQPDSSTSVPVTPSPSDLP
ncbi:hypothetical protein ACRRTK_010128 [Alexandromys fortis]